MGATLCVSLQFNARVLNINVNLTAAQCMVTLYLVQLLLLVRHLQVVTWATW